MSYPLDAPAYNKLKLKQALLDFISFVVRAFLSQA